MTQKEKVDIELQKLIDYIEHQEYNYLDEAVIRYAEDIQQKIKDLKDKLIEYEFPSDIMDCEASDDSILVKHARMNPAQAIWLTAGRKEIPVSRMTDTHLQNTLRVIEEGRIAFETDYERTFWESTFRAVLKLRDLKTLEPRIDMSACDATEVDIY